MLIKILIISIATCVIASPLPSKKDQQDTRVLFDQRQEGGWNVRADLKNIVVLVIPTPSESSSSSSYGLLDLLFKSLPPGTHLKRLHHTKKHQPDAAQETRHFIEAKTAPYHVDITKAKENLAKLHPANEEAILASSPTVALVKPESETPAVKSSRIGRATRISKAFVLTVPADEEFVISKTEDHKKIVKKDGKKKSSKDGLKHALKLLGAENEQCGPGMARDSYGICRTYKN